MKKILIITILLCLFFFVGCTKSPTGYAVYDTTQGSGTTDNTNDSNGTISFVEEGANESLKIIPEFRDIDYSLVGSKIILGGFLFDAETSEPIKGASVDIFCDDEAQYSATTNNDGSFYLSFYLSIHGKCKPGDEAWAQVVFEGKTYKSESIILPELKFLGGSRGGGGSNGGNSNGGFSTSSTQSQETCTDGIQNQDEAGIDCGGSCPYACENGQSDNVPEFSTITAGLALIGAGAYYLKKRNK